MAGNRELCKCKWCGLSIFIGQAVEFRPEGVYHAPHWEEKKRVDVRIGKLDYKHPPNGSYAFSDDGVVGGAVNKGNTRRR